MTWQYAGLVNRFLLGLLALVAGLTKLLVMTPAGFADMLAQIGLFWPLAFAWLILLVEIAGGIALLANWKVEWTALPQAAILLLAGFVVYLPMAFGSNNYINFVVHMLMASNYFLLAASSRLGKKIRSHVRSGPHKKTTARKTRKK